RLGVELATHKELPSLVRAFAANVQQLVSAGAVAIYLDEGGEALEFATTTGSAPLDVRSLPKASASIARLMSTGEAFELHDRDGEPETTRKGLQRFGHKSVFFQPLRVADRLVGVIFVTWREFHTTTTEERELLGVIAGIGAAQIRGLQLYRELDDAYLSTVGTLTATIEARDQYREDHQRRVAADAVALGERLGVGEAELRGLRYASSSTTTRCSSTVRIAWLFVRSPRSVSCGVFRARGTTRRSSTSSRRCSRRAGRSRPSRKRSARRAASSRSSPSSRPSSTRS